MAEYTEEFHRLGARTNLVGSENQLIARFVGGLQSDIKEKVKTHPLIFLSDAISLAETVEEMNEEQSRKSARRPWENSSGGFKRNTVAVPKNTRVQQPTSSKGKEVEQSAGKDKTTETAGRKAQGNPYNRPNMGKCFRCGQTCHLSNNCPSRNTLTFKKMSLH